MEFRDVKIVKNCNTKEEVPKVIDRKCESFDFEGKNFLKTVDKEILFIDDSIKIPNSKKQEIQPASQDIQPGPQENQQHKRVSPPACFDEIPQKLSEQMSLPIKNIKDLSFYETFIISSKTGDSEAFDIEVETDTDQTNEIGSACLMIEELSDGNILIFSIQQIFINGERTIYECLSVVTMDLKLVQEKQIERKCSDSEFMEKTIFIIPTHNGFRLIKSITKDENTECFSGDIEWKKSGDFLSSGTKALMIRKLVMENFKGCIQAYTCDIDGDFALSQFWFIGNETRFMYGHELTIKRVDQLLIYEENKKIERISSLFSQQTGQMLKQSREGHNYFIYMNPFEDASQKKYTKYLQENWQDDVELMSMYLEYKAKRKEELKKKFESPQMKLLLNDYILSLIKCKPKSVMNFTAEFMRKLERNTNVNVQMQIFKTVEQRAQQN